MYDSSYTFIYRTTNLFHTFQYICSCRCFKGISCTIYLFQLQLLYISKSQHNGMKTLSIFACSGSTCSSKKFSHKKWSSIDVPTVFVTSILNQPCFVANLNTYNVILSYQMSYNHIKFISYPWLARAAKPHATLTLRLLCPRLCL